MNEKCKKYESLFTFRDEKELEEHIKNCPYCKAEQEKMDKVSELIKEVKPYYMQKRKASYNRMKVACILCLGLFVGILLGHFSQNLIKSPTSYTTLSSDSTTSSTSSFNEYGMPVDSYGLITVN